MKTTFLTTLFFPFLFIPMISNSQDRSIYDTDNDPSEIKIQIVDIQSPSCNGEEDGLATVKVTGGTAPYSYNWNTFPNQYSKTATKLSSGIYFIYVEDVEGNSSFKSVHIDEPNTSLLAEKSNVDINELELTASVKSSSLLQFELDSEISEEKKVGELPVGIHKIKITDNNDCVMVQYIQVFEVSKNNQEKAIKSTASYSNKKGKKILVSSLIPQDKKEPKNKPYSIKLDKQ